MVGLVSHERMVRRPPHLAVSDVAQGGLTAGLWGIGHLAMRAPYPRCLSVITILVVEATSFEPSIEILLLLSLCRGGGGGREERYEEELPSWPATRASPLPILLALCSDWQGQFCLPPSPSSLVLCSAPKHLPKLPEGIPVPWVGEGQGCSHHRLGIRARAKQLLNHSSSLPPFSPATQRTRKPTALLLSQRQISFQLS